MSEREREAKWVLVPEDWLYSYDSQEGPPPPIPPDVWEQMVERGARALLKAQDGEWDTALDGTKTLWLADSAACLRAALGISDE